MVNLCECCHEPLETEAELLANCECRCAGYCVECSKSRCDNCQDLIEDCRCEAGWAEVLAGRIPERT